MIDIEFYTSQIKDLTEHLKESARDFANTVSFEQKNIDDLDIESIGALHGNYQYHAEIVSAFALSIQLLQRLINQVSNLNKNKEHSHE